MKKAISLGLVLALIISLLSFATASQKISNPDRFGGPDGIAADPDDGRHNSYGWCSEVFPQTDGDYLWVGMVRDLGYAMFAGGNLPFSSEIFGIPEATADIGARIYRQKTSDPDAEWELMYLNRGFSGYRRMIVYDGDLYVVVAGSYRILANYSAVLRFPKDFRPGDSPEIVMWETLPPDGKTEYYRAATIFDGKLHIGTFDGKIYATDGKDLQNLTPGSGAKSAGWELALDLNEYDELKEVAFIWDMIEFNDSIYAFVADGDIGGGGGFGVYKLTPGGQGGFDLRQIVGDESAPYPFGMGLDKLIRASPFLSTSFDKDYVYVSTFSGGSSFVGGLALGMIEETFSELYNPAFIFRFGEVYNWEVVVGDRAGEYVARNHDGTPLPHVGNQRAGFSIQDDDVQNISVNLYVWWMAEYQGKLYATTWDPGFFRDYFGLASLIFLNRVTDSALLTALDYVEDIVAQLGAIFSHFESVDMQELAADLGAYFQAVMDDIENEEVEIDVAAIIEGFVGILTDYFPVEALRADIEILVDTIMEMVEETGILELDAEEVVARTLTFLTATAMYFLDYSNPAGFDLYVSEDGKNFQPVTVDGYGDQNNYGGRVLVASEHGLFSTTANPFNGAQVWRVDPIEFGLYPNGPYEATLYEDGQAVVTVLVNDPPAGETLKMEHEDSDLVDIRLVKRPARTLIDVSWDNQIVTDPDTGLKAYDVTRIERPYQADMYDVIITPLKNGRQDLTLHFSLDGLTASRTIALTVDLDYVEPIYDTTYRDAFPDANFRAEVLNLRNADGGGRTADSYLTEADVAWMASRANLALGAMNIADLTGIAYFTGLTGLGFNNNQLTSVDISKNTALTLLTCQGNQLTALDVSQNTALTQIICNDNQLTALDVSQNPALALLLCRNNNMTSPDAVMGWRELGLSINSPQNFNSGTFRYYNQNVPQISTITSVNITGFVAPVAGQAPIGAGALNTVDEGYTITSVSWNPAATVFGYSTAYTATVVLIANNGFKFADLIPTVNTGTISTIAIDTEGNTLTFAVNFPATGPKPSLTTLKRLTTPNLLTARRNQPFSLADDIALTPSDAAANLTYTSLNPAVAAVDPQTGLITGQRMGVATIVVRDKSTGITALTLVIVI